MGAAEARAVVDAAVGGELLDGVDRPPARVALLRRAAPRRRRHPGFPPPLHLRLRLRLRAALDASRSRRARARLCVCGEEGGGEEEEEEEAMMISEGESSGSTAQLGEGAGWREALANNGERQRRGDGEVGAACAQKGGKGKCYGHSDENKKE